MKKKLAVIALAFALFIGFAADEKARANSAVSFNLFYSSLAPYGNWVSMDYGYAWAPTGVGTGWRPYMDGQWVWSDLGWTWSSYEPWGWATYHYGRWVMDPYYGWLWVPGTTWAPAWVSWYQTPGYVGWSPLPPDNNFFLEIGLGFGGGGYYGGGYYGGGYGYYPGYGYGGNYFSFNYYDYDYYGGHKHGKHHGNKYRHHDKGYYYDNDYYAPGDHCVFVPEDKFGNKNSKLVAVDIDKNRDLVTNRNTRNVTNIQVDNGKIHNLGPNRSVLENSGGAKIERVSLVDSDLTTVRNRGARGASAADNGKFAVYRPSIENKPGENPFSADAVHNPGRNGRNINNGSGTDRASLDSRANPGQGFGPGQGDRNGPTSGVRNPVDGNTPYGNNSPSEHGVIRRNGPANGPGEGQQLGSMRGGSDRPGMPSNGLAPNSGPMRPERGNLDSGGARGNASTMNRPQNSGPGMNRQSLNSAPNYGPRQEALSNPGMNGPSGRSMSGPRNYQPSMNGPRGDAPTMNRPSVERSQPNRQGNGSRNMMRPQNYSPDAGRPSMNRQQNYSPRMAPSQGRQGSGPAMNRQSAPSMMRGPERQSAPSQIRNTNSSPQQRQSYDRGARSNQGVQSVQPRSYQRPSSGNARSSGGSSGSRPSYNRGSTGSSGGSVRSAPSSSYRGGSSGGASFNRSSVRGR